MLKEDVSFLDYRLTTSFLGARKKDLEVGDMFIDKSGIYGIVIRQDKAGNFIEFIDGLQVYEKSDMKLKKLSTNNQAMFQYQQRYFGFITSAARVIKESIEDDFPHVNMFNNGKEIYVRGSTLSGITKTFTHAKISNSHSFFSVKLTPFYNMDIEAFNVKKSRRGSNYAFNMLRNLFIDIDLQLKKANRLKIVVGDSNTYNNPHWEKVIKKFSKFKMKYTIL